MLTYISGLDSSVIFSSEMLFHHVVREETGRVDRLSQVRVRLVSSVWQLLQPVQLDHTINTYIGGKHFNLC